jgi:hypothetical protein
MKSSRSIPSNEGPHSSTATGLLTSEETSKPSRTMPPNPPPVTTSHSTSTNTSEPPRKRMSNDRSSSHRFSERKTGSRPPEAEVGPLSGTSSSRSKSQDVDPRGLAQTPAGQDVRPPPPPKDPPTSGRSLPSPAPGMTSAESKLTSEPVPGEPQTPRGTHVPPGASVTPNESRGIAHPDMTGGHYPLNGQPAPNNVSSPPVCH